MATNEMTPLEILLVEDNSDHIELTLHALEINGWANRVHVVRDGAAALDFLFGAGSATESEAQRPRPRVIMLDLKLPKVNGLEVLRRLKSDVRTQMIPVVILTSSREEQDVVESYRLGVNSYIVKPVNFEQFTKSMKDIGLYWLLLNESPLW